MLSTAWIVKWAHEMNYLPDHIKYKHFPWDIPFLFIPLLFCRMRCTNPQTYATHYILPLPLLPQRSAQLVVVHVGLWLPFAPSARHLVRVRQLELAISALPRDARGIGRVAQQLQQELPQLDLSRTCRDANERMVNYVIQRRQNN